MPNQVEDLLKTVRLRWKGEKLGFEKLMLKGGEMKAQLVENTNEAYYQSAIFGKILKYVQQHPKNCRLKEAKSRGIVIVSSITSVELANQALDAMTE
jgi:transcription-repair coupling factor (superfamily II helicase)